MGPSTKYNNFEDPELEHIDGSEIAAAVDVSTRGTDNIFRPIFINQDDQIIALTQADALRLLKFLEKAVQFVDDYQKREIQ